MNCTNNLKLNIVKLKDGVKVPEYAHVGDAGLDLRACTDVVISPFQRVSIPCGFAIEIPAGYAGLVMPRSGLAIKQGLTMINSPGLIDSNFRGELCVLAINLDPENSIEITNGMRIAQLVIIHTPLVNVVCENTLSPSQRGENGFGSSGLN